MPGGYAAFVADAIVDAAGQAWPPFVLVAGLLLIGAVVEADGLFRAVGMRIERLGGGPIRLLAVLLGVEAIVTALLNLDTAVVFLTPIILHAARQRRCDERPFLYGSLFIANGASLLLPGSNLTNLIVLAHEHISGAEFARSMLLPWLVVVVVTVAFLVVAYPLRDERATASEPLPPLRLRLGAVATGAATVLILVLRDPALPVFAVGIAAIAVRRLRPRLDLYVLPALFLLAVALGTLARRWDGPSQLLGHAGRAGDAAIGALASVALNNLPAATLLSAQRPTHPMELLIGLNLGPNLAFTGSLAAYLWYRAARRAGARPSLKQASLLGALLVPLTIAAALAALAVKI
ncbi:MAG: arsenical pump rane protein [Actinomycetota bacterium]